MTLPEKRFIPLLLLPASEKDIEGQGRVILRGGGDCWFSYVQREVE